MAQNQGANWFFANNKGIQFDFCSNEPINVAGGQIANLTGYIHRAVSSISNEDGNLLFYTDGRTVWNREHESLPNANNISNTLLEGVSNVITLPYPNNPNLYVIFTVDSYNGWAQARPAEGLNYSIVDLSLNNGLGDIVTDQKNIHLITYLEEDEDEVYEKASTHLTAIRGADCNSYWVIAHFRSKFFAFKLDENGVNHEPVVSVLPPLVPLFEEAIGNSSYDANGSIKSNHTGSKIVMSMFHPLRTNPFTFSKTYYAYDFDKTTGELSNPKKLYENNDHAGNTQFSFEFSPLDRYLYILDYTANGITDLARFNLNSTQPTRTLLYSDDYMTFQKMQLGPDGKIYIAQGGGEYPTDYGTHLSVIANPDSPDASLIEYNVFGFESGPGSDALWLPNYNPQWFDLRTDIVRNGISKCELFLCGSQSQFLRADEIVGADYVWFKDGAEIIGETAFELEVTETGFYELFMEPNDGRCSIEGWATVSNSTQFAVAVNTAIQQCDEDGMSDGLTVFNLNNSIPNITNNTPNMSVRFFLSQQDLEDQGFGINAGAYSNVSNPQTIYALVTNTLSGCTESAEITLEVTTTDVDDIALSVCDEDGTNDGITSFDLNQFIPQILEGLPSNLQVIFYESYDDALLEAFPLVTPYTNTTPFNQLIYARVENDNNCFGISDISLEILNPPDINTEAQEIYCLNTFPETIILDSGLEPNEVNTYSFLWSTGETSQNIAVNTAGTFTVSVSNDAGCSSTRSIVVEASNIATISNIEVVDISNNNSISIFVSGEGDYEYAIENAVGPYQQSNTFENLAPGFYTVFVRDKNNCGISEEMVSVLGFPRFFTPNGDGDNDYWQISGLNATTQISEPIRIYNRYGKILLELNPQSSGWDGRYNGILLPSSDYWFTVVFSDGRKFNGHFALKR